MKMLPRLAISSKPTQFNPTYLMCIGRIFDIYATKCANITLLLPKANRKPFFPFLMGLTAVFDISAMSCSMFAMFPKCRSQRPRRRKKHGNPVSEKR